MSITVDGATFAKGYIAIRAASRANDRPQLDKTVFIQQYVTGLRLIATDSKALLSTWIPAAGPDASIEPEPELEEIPWATAVAVDADGRGHGLLEYMLRLSRKEGFKGVEAVVKMNVPWQSDLEEEQQLDGFVALAVTIEYPDHETVVLPVYEGSYPDVAALRRSHKPKRTVGLALSQEMTALITKAARPFGPSTAIRCTFAGESRAVAVEFGEEPAVYGLVMPQRWDFDRGAPATADAEPADEDPEEG